MELETVLRDKRADHLTIITINRPEVRNALNTTVLDELSQIFGEFNDDPNQWIAILTGAGDKAFSAGNDLRYHAELRAKTGGRPQSPPKGFGGLANRHDLDKPVIAAVNGVCAGGGMELAMACDVRFASESAKFGMREVTLGIIPGAAITYHWNIEDTAGDKLSTPDKLYVHQDNRFTFKTLQKENVTLYYYSGSDASAQSVLDAATDSLDKTSALEQVQVTFPVKVFMYRTAGEMQPAIAVGGRSPGVQILGEYPGRSEKPFDAHGRRDVGQFQ